MPDVKLISQTRNVENDLTKGFAYDKLVQEEIEHYSKIEVTDKLHEGGIHAFKAWDFYFEYLKKNVFGASFFDEVVAAANGKENPLILSLGCGYGGDDLVIARRLQKPFKIIGVDLNPEVYSRAQRCAEEECLDIEYLSCDLNFIDIQPGSFDVIYAHASLHHLLNLEHVFAQIHGALKPDGLFIVFDVIGKTQVLFWRENVEFLAGLLRRLPRRFRPPVGKRFWKYFWFDPYTIMWRYREPAIQHGMEGIRQEEIEAVMSQWFEPVKRFRYNAFMRTVCTNWHLGPRIDPEKPEDRKYLEDLIEIELEQVRSGKLKPTELFGVYERIPQPSETASAKSEPATL